MQVPILSGIYTNDASDYRVSYPLNLEPVPIDTGLSGGYLRPADGLVLAGTGPGQDRGGINWNGTHYRVMGTKFVSISASNVVTVIGDVGGSGQCVFTYGSTYLAIVSSLKMYYWDGTTLTQVTNIYLGNVIDAEWVDGYYMTTDGTNLVVTELNDPFTVNPLKYGSSEADPDPIVGLLKFLNEIYAVNRYTIETFQNVGGAFFPFQRVEGAIIPRGALSRDCCCIYMDQIAFLGGAKNESPAIWIGLNGQSQKLSTREVELIFDNYTLAQLSTVLIETRVSSAQNLLYVHLPDQTLVFNGIATQVLQKPVWYRLSSSLDGIGAYRGRNIVRVNDNWYIGDPSTSGQFGVFSELVSSHFGNVVGWEFGTQILYNEGNGALFHELELVALPGRAAFGANPTITTQYSVDGTSWSMPKSRTAGTNGQRMKRMTWFNQGFMRNWRVQRFRGTSDAHISFSRLEARLEPLNA